MENAKKFLIICYTESDDFCLIRYKEDALLPKNPLSLSEYLNEKLHYPYKPSQNEEG